MKKRIEIKSIIKAFARIHQGYIDGFMKEINKEGDTASNLKYALHWHAESAQEGACFFAEARPFINLISEEDYSLNDMKAICIGTRRNIMSFFKHAGFRPNSTSPMSNLESIAIGKANGKILEMIDSIESVLEGDGEE
jgi:hypothetical protein